MQTFELLRKGGLKARGAGGIRSGSHDYARMAPMKDDSLCIRRHLAAHLKDV